jgi:hypothetical protein
MGVVGGRGDRPDSDDAGVRCHLRRPVRGVGDPEQGDIVVLAVVASISLVGEPPNSSETSGLVEVVDAAAIVAVSGGEQALLAAAVVDEPSGGAGIRGLAVAL